MPSPQAILEGLHAISRPVAIQMTIEQTGRNRSQARPALARRRCSSRCSGCSGSSSPGSFRKPQRRRCSPRSGWDWSSRRGGCSFSRAPWSDRVGAIVLMVAALFATSRVVHASIAGGMMGFMLVMYAIPALSLALVGRGRGRPSPVGRARRATMAGAILIACGVFTLLADWRRGGQRRGRSPLAVDADAGRAAAVAGQRRAAAHSAGAGGRRGASGRARRRSRRLPNQRSPPHGLRPRRRSWSGPASGAPSATASFAACGSRRTGPGSRRPTLWRRPIGPGWSSFAVRGDLFYTQEQRGDEEIVSCYGLTTGEPVWRHRDAIRFWESNGGAGPRATPTLAGGRVYAMGATGILNALDAASGAVAWSRNVASDTDTKVPIWGFAASPLVVDDDGDRRRRGGRLAAYDVADGKRTLASGRPVAGATARPTIS